MTFLIYFWKYIFTCLHWHKLKFIIYIINLIQYFIQEIKITLPYNYWSNLPTYLYQSLYVLNSFNPIYKEILVLKMKLLDSEKRWTSSFFFFCFLFLKTIQIFKFFIYFRRHKVLKFAIKHLFLSIIDSIWSSFITYLKYNSRIVTAEISILSSGYFNLFLTN